MTRRSTSRGCEISQRRYSRHHCASWCQRPSSSAGVTVHRSTTWGFGMGSSLRTRNTGHPLSRTHLAAAANVVLTLSWCQTLLTTSALRSTHCFAARVAHGGTCREVQTAGKYLGILSAGFTSLNGVEDCGNLGL